MSGGGRHFSLSLSTHPSWSKHSRVYRRRESELILSCSFLSSSFFPLHKCSTFWFECCAVLVTQMCLTLCNPMDYSPSGSSAHGISHIRILKWDAVSSSRGFSWSRDQTCVSCISFTASRFFTAVPIPGLKTQSLWEWWTQSEERPLMGKHQDPLEERGKSEELKPQLHDKLSPTL